jgi:hypothetical protein
MKMKNGMTIRFLKLNGEPVKQEDRFSNEVERRIVEARLHADSLSEKTK